MYEGVNNFSEGLAHVAKKVEGYDKNDTRSMVWGFIDVNNKTVIPFEYSGASGSVRDNRYYHNFDGKNVMFKNGYAKVSKGNIYDYQWEPTGALSFKDSWKGNINWFYIDKKGNRVNYSEPEDKADFSVIMRNGKMGMINKNNEVIVPFIYNIEQTYTYDNGKEISKFSDNSGCVFVDKKTGEIYSYFDEFNRYMFPVDDDILTDWSASNPNGFYYDIWKQIISGK